MTGSMARTGQTVRSSSLTGPEVATWGWSKEQVTAETGYYRLVSSQGTIRNINGRAVAPVASEDEFPAELDGQLFVDLVRAADAAAP